MKLNYQKKITRRVTIKNLADDLGLSVGAVSQALNPRDTINIKLKPETIERVRAYANQMNYRPHAGASSIRSRHFSNIGYMVAQDDPDTVEPAAAQFGIHDASLEHNFRVTMLRLPSIEARDREAVSRVFNEAHLDALIMLNYTGVLPTSYEQVLAETDFPIVYLNIKQDFQAVYVNDKGGAKQMTAHLVSQGYRKITFFKTHQEEHKPAHTSFQERYEGYCEGMQAAGLVPTPAWILDEKGVEATLDWLYNPQTRPDAIFAYCDSNAAHIARLAYQQGLRIPDDMGLAGFNDDAFGRLSWVPLTTMAVPYYQMAYAAFNRAMSQINSENPTPFPSICIDPRLVVRASTAPKK